MMRLEPRVRKTPALHSARRRIRARDRRRVDDVAAPNAWTYALRFRNRATSAFTQYARMRAKRATRILNLERSRWFLFLCACCVTMKAVRSTNHAPRAAIAHTVMRLSAQEKKIVPAVTDVDELVVVPARAVYTGSDFAKAEEDPSDWALERDQTSSEGYVRSLVEHIEIGVREAAKNPNAALVFSGGKSTRDAGAAMTRASSYW